MKKSPLDFCSISDRSVSSGGTLLPWVSITALASLGAVKPTLGSKVPPLETLLPDMEKTGFFISDDGKRHFPSKTCLFACCYKHIFSLLFPSKTCLYCQSAYLPALQNTLKVMHISMPLRANISWRDSPSVPLEFPKLVNTQSSNFGSLRIFSYYEGALNNM